MTRLVDISVKEKTCESQAMVEVLVKQEAEQELEEEEAHEVVLRGVFCQQLE